MKALILKFNPNRPKAAKRRPADEDPIVAQMELLQIAEPLVADAIREYVDSRLKKVGLSGVDASDFAAAVANLGRVLQRTAPPTVNPVTPDGPILV